ncbi:MAG: flagellar biosynthesis anti-sigma factor FlgM [Armatimonadota bacterium]
MMRIESGVSSPTNALVPPSRTQQPPAGVAQRGGSQISVTGRLFLTGRQALASLPAVRADAVRQFQTLLSSGHYQANGEACARAIISGEEVVAHA